MIAVANMSREYLQATQEHVMRLPEGLKRRKLVNGLSKAKYR